ncbi:hypothetical protein ACTOWA_00290 [Herbaspirillum seropedicae]|uniref:hypothetical protein n=1 Tax=Herbaspirillum seropedicae TaxID=964 RepID=UPI00285FCF94|nr:hypothetical protein [Herbaspirillum seropedicae]MDR6397972.1 hypothetical protein [Herbaspirillum seropedicae]
MSDYLTVVIKLPANKDARKAITSQLRLGEEFQGGLITGMSMADEMTLNEKLTELAGEDMFEEAERLVAEVHAAQPA